ncbi:MAG: tetratricopeptide repeat protein [Elusimicrobiota bacterium]
MRSTFPALLTLLLATASWAQESELFPKTSYLHYLQYLIFEKEGKLDRALPELIMAYEANPDGQELLSEIVILSLHLGKVEFAAHYAERAYAGNPRDPKVKLLRAQVQHAQGYSHEAIKELQAAKTLDPADSQVILELAAIYADLEMKQEALHYLDLYLGLEPATPELLKIKAEYQMRERDSGAVETYLQALALDPEDSEALDGLARAYRVFSSSSNMREMLMDMARKNSASIPIRARLCPMMATTETRFSCWRELLESDPANPEAFVKILDHFESKEQWQEALEFLQDNEGHFGASPIFGLKESFYLLQLGELEEAVAILEQTSRTHPDNDEAAYFLALGYQDLGRLSDAQMILERLYRKRQDWKEMAYNYALLLGENAQGVAMEKVLADLVRRWPDDMTLVNALGFTWADSGKNLQQARVMIEKAVAEEPENYYFQDSLGWVLFKMGDGEQSAKVIREASVKSQDPEIMLHLARVMGSQGRFSEAWESYYQAFFDLGRRKRITPRLNKEMESVQRQLSGKHEPDPRDILGKVAPQGDVAGTFRCEWGVMGKQPFRTKIGIERRDQGEGARISFWPPGSFMPMDVDELAGNFPKSNAGLFKGMADAMDQFFYSRQWAQTPKRDAKDWKIDRDLSVRFSGKGFKLKFYGFYSSQSQAKIRGVLPRYIGVEADYLKGTCEALGYEQR